MGTPFGNTNRAPLPLSEAGFPYVLNGAISDNRNRLECLTGGYQQADINLYPTGCPRMPPGSYNDARVGSRHGRTHPTGAR